MAAPLVVWTRFRIPSGPIPPELAQTLSAHWQAHTLAGQTRFRLIPYLYSIDQLPRGVPVSTRNPVRVMSDSSYGVGPALESRSKPRA